LNGIDLAAIGAIEFFHQLRIKSPLAPLGFESYLLF
jgi:hypothetical protein